MTTPLFILLASLLLSPLTTKALDSQDVPNGSLYLVRDGKAQAAVVVSAQATADERAAAEELIAYVEKITGARLAVTDTAPKSGVRIHVGFTACPSSIRDEMKQAGAQGFLIRTTADQAICLGGTGRDSASFAVYEFLEQFGGVRWLWPGALGEVLPKRANLFVPPTRQRVIPAFLWRDLGPRGPLWGPLDKWEAERKLGVTEEHQRAQALWEKRNRFGGLNFYGGHAFATILAPEKFGRNHPEYFALVKGKRDYSAEGFDGKHGRQPCTSNPDVIRIVSDYCVRFFHEHPDCDAFNISLNDGRGLCECAPCRALDTGDTQMQNADPEMGAAARYTVVTDRILTFANQVCENLGRSHPDKKLILFAYGQYRQPPKRLQPHPNLIIQYTMNAATHWNPDSAKRQIAEVAAWSGVAKHLAIYEYYIQAGFPDLPRLMPGLIAPSVRRLHEMGYRYYQTQAGDGYAINGFNYYLLARLLWNPNLDAKRIQQDYVEKGFGKAAPAIARYLDRMAERWRETSGKVMVESGSVKEYQRVLEAWPSSFLKACQQDLDEAANSVDGVEKTRVQFLEQGLSYVKLTVAAVEKTKPLLETGWKFFPNVKAPPQADQQQLQQARLAWEARERYVESLKNDFVLAHVWIRYNDLQRAFNPLERMRQHKSTTKPK